MKFITRRAYPMSKSWTLSDRRYKPWTTPTPDGRGNLSSVFSYSLCSGSGTEPRLASKSFSRGMIYCSCWKEIR